MVDKVPKIRTSPTDEYGQPVTGRITDRVARLQRFRLDLPREHPYWNPSTQDKAIPTAPDEYRCDDLPDITTSWAPQPQFDSEPPAPPVRPAAPDRLPPGAQQTPGARSCSQNTGTDTGPKLAVCRLSRSCRAGSPAVSGCR